jgi:hypothetical protein
MIYLALAADPTTAPTPVVTSTCDSACQIGTTAGGAMASVVLILGSIVAVVVVWGWIKSRV